MMDDGLCYTCDKIKWHDGPHSWEDPNWPNPKPSEEQVMGAHTERSFEEWNAANPTDYSDPRHTFIATTHRKLVWHARDAEVAALREMVASLICGLDSAINRIKGREWDADLRALLSRAALLTGESNGTNE